MSFLWGNTNQQPPDPKKFANISNDQINSNQQAVPVKYLAGRNYVAGDYISPAYNPKTVPVKSVTGKGQSSTTGYKYFADFALLFCTGGRRPVDAVYKVIVDSDIRWDGEADGSHGVQRGTHDSESISVDGLGDMRIYWGSETQATDTTLLSVRNATASDHQDKTTFNPNHQSGATRFPNTSSGFDAGDPDPFSGHYDQHPAYLGQCYCVFKNWKLGRDRTSIPNIQLELARGCPAPWLSGGGTPFPPDNRGVNPIAILYDWLTDTRFGMALPDAMLNLPTFSSTYTALEAYVARLSPLLTSQTDFRQIIAQLLEYYDGWIRRNATKIEVGFWKSGNILPVATLTDLDLLGEPELVPQGWGPTLNEITVVYKDKDHHFNDYTQVYRDPNNFRITGGPRPETYDRPWITDADTAKQYARTSGAAAALPFTQGDLTVKREWLSNNNILPGVVFRYKSAFYGLDFLMRLEEIEYEADHAAAAKMSVQWERSKWPSLYIPAGLHGPGGFFLGPRAIWQSRITEVPYLLADQKFDTQLITLAVRGNVEVQGYRTWLSLDGGSVYNIIPNESSTSAFASFGRLVGAITGPPNQVTTVQIQLFGIDLDEVVAQTPEEQQDDTLLLFSDAEVMSVGRMVAVGSGKFNVNLLRGRFGTAVQAHAINTSVFFLYRDRMRLLDNAGFIPGTAIKIKLQPFTADLDYTLNVPPNVVIDYTIVGFGDIAAPTLSPAAGTFVGSVQVNLGAIPAGCTARYTRNGTAVTGSSAVFPAVHYINLTATTTLRIRFYSTNGQSSPELTATYTKVDQIPHGELPPCGAPSWVFSGVLKHNAGNLTLTATTPGSTIYWSNVTTHGTFTGNGTPTQVIAIGCNEGGDVVEFWAIHSNFSESQHTFLDNTREFTYGGGGHLPPRLPP